MKTNTNTHPSAIVGAATKANILTVVLIFRFSNLKKRRQKKSSILSEYMKKLKNKKGKQKI